MFDHKFCLNEASALGLRFSACSYASMGGDDVGNFIGRPVGSLTIPGNADLLETLVPGCEYRLALGGKAKGALVAGTLTVDHRADGEATCSLLLTGDARLSLDGLKLTAADGLTPGASVPFSLAAVQP